MAADPDVLIDPTRLTMSAFARRVGVTLPAVREGIASGRLTPACIARDARTGRPYIVNIEVALSEWELNRRGHIVETVGRRALPGEAQPNGIRPDGRRQQPPAPTGGSAYARARLREIEANANLRELEVDRKAGRLVDKVAVERALATRMANLATNMLAIPSRLRQRCPDSGKEVYGAVSDLIREVLEDHSRASANSVVLDGGQ